MIALADIPIHLLVAGGLLAALIAGFLIAFLAPGLVYLFRLRRIQKQLGKLEATSQLEEFRKLFAKDKRLAHLWKEFQDSLHVQRDDRDGQSRIVAIRSTLQAEAYFNSQFVVDSRLHTDFFKHLPGIFTGIGIIGTFTGLIEGLRQFKVSENATTVRSSLESLMHSVGNAFLISAAAITAAMIVTFIEKLLLAALYRRTEEIAHGIDAFFDSGAGEEYLSRLVKASEDSASQSKILKDSLVNELGDILRQLTDAQLATSEKLHQQLAQRFDEATGKQAQSAREDSKALVDAISASIKESLKEPLETIASTVKSASGDQSATAVRMLNDVMVSFSQRLNDLFGGQISGLNDLNKQTARGMQDAVNSLNALVSKLEESGKRSTEDMASEMAVAIRSMEERQSSINSQTQAFVEQIQKLVESSQADTQQKLQETLESIGHQMTAIVQTLGESQRTVFEGNRAREEAMGDRARGIVSEMTGAVQAAVSGMAEASSAMARNMATLTTATTTSVDKLNIGAERLSTAAITFATAGERVTNVMTIASAVSEKLAEVSGSLTSGSAAIQELLRDYRVQREAVGQLLVEVRTTVELARKEASITADVLHRIEGSTQKLGAAQLAADAYLEGVSDVLLGSSEAFRSSVVSTLGKVNHDFHDKLSSAVGLLSTAVQELAITLEITPPSRRGAP